MAHQAIGTLQARAPWLRHWSSSKDIKKQYFAPCNTVDKHMIMSNFPMHRYRGLKPPSFSALNLKQTRVDQQLGLFVIGLELLLVGAGQVQRAVNSESVTRLHNRRANRGERSILADERAKRANLVQPLLVDRLEHAAHRRTHRQPRAVAKFGRWRNWQPPKLRRLHVRIDQRRNLRVAQALLRDGRPRAVAAVQPAVGLDQHGTARLVVLNLDLRVHGAVLDAERVEHAKDVLDHALEVRLALGAERHQTHAVIHNWRAVEDALVVLPDRHALVLAVARDRVHHVLVAAQVLL
mmetsp:Transcript_28674/g.62781  ORF Transcript_28674/g.62781 Transcript_28674/m.62781 type:complete len:294 (-) Transcript_28674:817-1698(-)